MSLNLGDLVAHVVVDASGVSSGMAVAQAGLTTGAGQLEDAGKKGGKRFGAGLLGSLKSSFVGPLAGVLGGAAVAGAFSSLSGLASDYNETLSKSAAIFGDQQSAMTAWASNAARTVGLSKSAALDAAAGFGDMFSQIGFTGDAAAKMSQSVVQASADLGSFSNLDTADVSDRIAAAFRGEYDSLQAVIPNINAARVQSEALAATGKKNASQLTAQEKATAVLAIVQKDGARAMGDFAKTSDGAANKSKIMAARLEDQKVKAGQLLLPVKQLALDGFGLLLSVAEQVTPVVTSLIGFIGDHSTAFTVAAVAVGILAAATAAHSLVLGINSGAVTRWVAQTTVAKAATAAWATVQAILNSSLLANPITWVVIAIAALVAGLVIAYQKSETFRAIVTGAFDAVKSAASAALGWIRANWPLILAILAGPVGLAVLAIVKNWDKITSGAGRMKDGVVSKFGELVEFVRGIPNKILTALGSLGKLLYRAGTSIISGLLSGITDKFEDVKGFVGGIGSWIGDHKGPISYDRQLLVPAGQAIMYGLNRGLLSGMPSLAATMGAITGAVRAPVVGSLDSAPASARAAAVGDSRVGTQGDMVIHLTAELDGEAVYRSVERRSVRNARRSLTGASGLAS